MIMRIPQCIIEIQKRAELCLPILRHITEAFLRIRDPISKVIDRIIDLRNLKYFKERKQTKEVINRFLLVESLKDQDNKGGKPKRVQIFEELSTMVSLAKRLEFEIKKCIDTPLKMLRILKQTNRKGGRELLNEDLK